MGITSIIVLVVLAAIILYFISSFNELTKNKNQIQNSISSLDALFIKRDELIGNLVTVCEQYMEHEKSTLLDITALRGGASKSDLANESQEVEAFKKVMIQIENYPNLKADTQFTNLQYSWNEVEEQISAGRRYVSTSITVYNNSVQTFPNNIIASATGFKEHKWEYATEKQKQKKVAKDMFSKKL